jgi:acetate kinase
MSRVLVLNTGSSSIKYRLFQMAGRTVLATGLLERIGEDDSRLTHQAEGAEPLVVDGRVADHQEGFERVFAAFDAGGGLSGGLAGIGHRVVHGGERFSAPARIDDEVIAAIREQVPLAPLHNPSNLLGIQIARAAFPKAPQVAVFDTAFHRTMPPRAYRYALPRELADRLHIRRYGFHGTSHAHVSRKAAEHLGRPPAAVNLVTLHLGNGASVAAVAGGRCIDTSMGLTPLEGLVMGTRSGDLDPAIVLFLYREARLSLDEVDTLLNRESGMKGLTGDNDLRQIERRQAGAGGAGRLLLPHPQVRRRLRRRAGPPGRAGVHRRGGGEQRRRPRRGLPGAGAVRRPHRRRPQPAGLRAGADGVHRRQRGRGAGGAHRRGAGDRRADPGHRGRRHARVIATPQAGDHVHGRGRTAGRG